MNSTKTIFVVLFCCLMLSSTFIVPIQAGKKKLIAAFLLGAALAKKPKILPIPLPLPIPVKVEHKKYVPYPEPYPVYVEHSYGYGGYGGYDGGYGGYGGGYGYGGY